MSHVCPHNVLSTASATTISGQSHHQQQQNDRSRNISWKEAVMPDSVATNLEAELELLPDFQRINISGEDTSGVSQLVN